MFSSLAGQVHPFSFKPLDGGFAEEIFGLHFGNEAGISTFLNAGKCQSKCLFFSEMCALSAQRMGRAAILFV